MRSDADEYCLNCLTPISAAPGVKPSCACGLVAGPRDVAAASDVLAPGTILQDKYVVGRHLGRGGFGVTYFCADLDLGFRVAIKEYLPRELCCRSPGNTTVVPGPMPSDVKSFQQGLPRFLEEGRALARFSGHPNIVDVLNFFQANGTGYLVMRYLDGMTLRAALERAGKRFPESLAVSRILDGCNGLEAVHEAGLLHRDIKPDNLFLVGPSPGSNQQERTILLDFGAARHYLRQSSPLSSIWTPGFAPPEQVTRSDAQGPWTDVYALGATLYQMLVGSSPPPVSLDGKRSGRFRSPAEILGRDVSANVSYAVMKALELKPRARFQNIHEFRNAIEEVAQHISRPPPPPPPPPGPRGLALRGLKGEYAGSVIPLQPAEDLTLGRNPKQCNVVFDSETSGVSRCHLVLRTRWDSSGVEVMDPSSACGTWLDSFGPIEHRQWYEVKPGQRIVLGSLDVVFEVVEDD